MATLDISTVDAATGAPLPGASIIIDNTFALYTPRVITGLTPGLHDLRVYLVGYSLVSQTITLSETAPLVLVVPLVAVPPPIAAFTPVPSSGPAPLTVFFSNQSTGSPNQYVWDFGDGTTGSGRSPTHIYEYAGLFTVILTVTGDGGSTSATATIEVLGEPPIPVADFVASPYAGDVPLAVEFTNQSLYATEYQWDFGDGSPISTELNPTHVYNNSGVFTVVLEAINTSGVDTASLTITVNAPVNTGSLQINATADGVPVGAQVYLDLVGYGSTPVTIEGLEPGSYALLLSLTGYYNFEKTVVITAGQTYYIDAALIPVTEPPPEEPVSGFTASPASGTVPLTVQFTNQSTGEIETYLWDFGDGFTSSEISPSHTFLNAGNYTVELTVSGPGGSNSSSLEINVKEPGGADNKYLYIAGAGLVLAAVAIFTSLRRR